MLSLKSLELTFRTRLPYSTREARELVMSSIRGQPPLTTHQLYECIQRRERREETKGVATYEPSSKSRQAIDLLRPLRWKRVHSNGPIPSYNYLKDIVLPDLVKHNQVEKVHTLRTISREQMQKKLQAMSKAARQALGDKPIPQASVWLWRPLSPTQLKKIKEDKVQARLEEKQKARVFGKEVGAGTDWSHLNKRRQRARVRKVARDIRWLREIQEVKEGKTTLSGTTTSHVRDQ